MAMPCDSQTQPGSATPLPLESLDLSGNALHMLPPWLCVRLPRLRRLVCSDNTRPLVIPSSLAGCIGVSASPEVVELHGNELHSFVLSGDTVEAPFSALRELLLDRNKLSGTFSLGLREDMPFPVLAGLRRISVEYQPLQAVGLTIFTHCPGLNALSLKGNPNKDEINRALGKAAVYRRWQEGKAEVINKKIGTGGSAALMQCHHSRAAMKAACSPHSTWVFFLLLSFFFFSTIAVAGSGVLPSFDFGKKRSDLY
jgi:hypothetical protein